MQETSGPLLASTSQLIWPRCESDLACLLGLVRTNGINGAVASDVETGVDLGTESEQNHVADVYPGV